MGAPLDNAASVGALSTAWERVLANCLPATIDRGASPKSFPKMTVASALCESPLSEIVSWNGPCWPYSRHT
jgi:hypothetical protein